MKSHVNTHVTLRKSNWRGIDLKSQAKVIFDWNIVLLVSKMGMLLAIDGAVFLKKSTRSFKEIQKDALAI